MKSLYIYIFILYFYLDYNISLFLLLNKLFLYWDYTSGHMVCSNWSEHFVMWRLPYTFVCVLCL